ncbi:hypothetical protein DAPPUDRAFT_326889 [Daphnia pulex]|uniref:Uncharacterized protein n=1 Tax=Daphnia pulex TaxID=6669 RepID=E9H934_DAPPU|nr:hypothetical protein DAPPUDRAFT_326889 [Daphnia pulex]|eukprot:EFX71719.1 hypothetical protein DAPPUDRAFT_326889 [Daphnia pulex]
MANNVSENHLKDVSHVPKFDGSNFREWSYELRMILQQLGLLSIMEARVGHTIPTETYFDSHTCKNFRLIPVTHIYESQTYSIHTYVDLTFFSQHPAV